MDNFTLFDYHNDALLLFYNINTPICILLNLLAIYLIPGNGGISLAPSPLPGKRLQNTMTGLIV
uniref:G_PROTEIN_RECEP_F1_2 domain-containing protein n=1 Tax=Heterorhabditis bacteriophora TaxID=37862 RepID=A0A1I7XJI4_HETBA